MTNTRDAVSRMAAQQFPDTPSEPPSDHALDSILKQERDDAPRRTRLHGHSRQALLVAAAVAIVVAGAAGVVTTVGDGSSNPTRTPGIVAGPTLSPVVPQPGDAPTPPLLTFVALNEPASAAEILDGLAQRAQEQPDDRGSGRYEYVHTRGWYLSTKQMVDGTVLSSRIEPAERELWVAADGSGRIEETRNGTETDFSSDFGPGELGAMTIEDASSVQELEERLLADHQGRTAGQWFVAIGDIWRQQSVSPQLQSALLSILAEQNGIDVLGTVEDRAGRPGIAVSTIAERRDTQYVLILDADTGDVLDFETIALAPHAAPAPVTPPATISYTLWLDSGRTDSTTERP